MLKLFCEHNLPIYYICWLHCMFSRYACWNMEILISLHVFTLCLLSKFLKGNAHQLATTFRIFCHPHSKFDHRAIVYLHRDQNKSSTKSWKYGRANGSPNSQGWYWPIWQPQKSTFQQKLCNKMCYILAMDVKKKYLQFPDPYQTVADIQFLNALNFILYEWSPIPMLRPK